MANTITNSNTNNYNWY